MDRLYTLWSDHYKRRTETGFCSENKVIQIRFTFRFELLFVVVIQVLIDSTWVDGKHAIAVFFSSCELIKMSKFTWGLQQTGFPQVVVHTFFKIRGQIQSNVDESTKQLKTTTTSTTSRHFCSRFAYITPQAAKNSRTLSFYNRFHQMAIFKYTWLLTWLETKSMLAKCVSI